jgi:hypothetical protein
MADGTTKPIEQVQAGDLVLSLNLSTGKTESKRVARTFVREAEHLHAVTTAGNETFYTTDGHPFLTPQGYVNAEDLATGTPLVTRIQPTTSLANPVGTAVNWGGTQVSHNLKFDQPSVFFGHHGGNGYRVYNFEVEDNHNYFVGKTDGGVCVHNADTKDYVPAPGTKLPRADGVPGGRWTGVRSHKAAFAAPESVWENRHSPHWEDYDCPAGSCLIFTEAICHSGARWTNAEWDRVAIFNCYNTLNARWHAWRAHPELLEDMPPLRRTLCRAAHCQDNAVLAG